MAFQAMQYFFQMVTPSMITYKCYQETWGDKLILKINLTNSLHNPYQLVRVDKLKLSYSINDNNLSGFEEVQGSLVSISNSFANKIPF